jgi:hypothetical protein
VHEAWAAFPDKDELAELGVSALAAQSRVLQLRPRGTTGLSPGTQLGGRSESEPLAGRSVGFVGTSPGAAGIRT